MVFGFRKSVPVKQYTIYAFTAYLHTLAQFEEILRGKGIFDYVLMWGHYPVGETRSRYFGWEYSPPPQFVGTFCEKRGGQLSVADIGQLRDVFVGSTTGSAGCVLSERFIQFLQEREKRLGSLMYTEVYVRDGERYVFYENGDFNREVYELYRARHRNGGVWLDDLWKDFYPA
jgi:hypothetical protein